jgi:hypothetical protein
MSSGIAVDVFVEDRAHEEFLVPMLRRVASEEEVPVEVRVRSARGGHARALEELQTYQVATRKGIAGLTVPDLLVAGVDGNCQPFAKARREVRDAVREPFLGRLVVASPDPHVERWYLADPEAFFAVVGRRPTLTRKKCKHAYYKSLLAATVREAGHPPTLGGIEFARDLVERMDLFRAGKNDRSLKAFIDDLRSGLRSLRAPLVEGSR